MTKLKTTEVKRFITQCLIAAGANTAPARQQATLIAFADTLGHKDNGLSQLGTLINNIQNGSCAPNNVPEILKEKSSTAWVDAKNVMGATAGWFVMDIAAKKANETGVGWVALKGTTYNCKPHSFWSHKAADMGLIGMVFTNSSSEANKKAAAPKYKTQRSTSARATLAALVDMLSGTTSSPIETKYSYTHSEPWEENIVHCFVVVNPGCFALGIDNKLMDNLHWKQETMNQNLLEVPLGEIVKKVTMDTNDSGIIHYEPELIVSCRALARKLKVMPLRFLEVQKNCNN